VFLLLLLSLSITHAKLVYFFAEYSLNCMERGSFLAYFERIYFCSTVVYNKQYKYFENKVVKS